MNIHDWLALTRLMSIDTPETFSQMLSTVEHRYAENNQTNSPLLMIAQALKVYLCVDMCRRVYRCICQCVSVCVGFQVNGHCEITYHL